MQHYYGFMNFVVLNCGYSGYMPTFRLPLLCKEEILQFQLIVFLNWLSKPGADLLTISKVLFKFTWSNGSGEVWTFYLLHQWLTLPLQHYGATVLLHQWLTLPLQQQGATGLLNQWPDTTTTTIGRYKALAPMTDTTMHYNNRELQGSCTNAYNTMALQGSCTNDYNTATTTLWRYRALAPMTITLWRYTALATMPITLPLQHYGATRLLHQWL